MGMTQSKLRAEKNSEAGQKTLFCPVKVYWFCGEKGKWSH